MNNLMSYSETVFENIKHIDEYGNEYWLARELSKVLEYREDILDNMGSDELIANLFRFLKLNKN